MTSKSSLLQLTQYFVFDSLFETCTSHVCRCHAENRFAITKILIRLKVVLPNKYCGLRVADHHRSKRIIGGVDVNNARTWPWMVSCTP